MHVVETGAVPGAGAGAGAVSWLCTWWRQVAGAGAGFRCWVPGLVSAVGDPGLLPETQHR